MEKAIGIDGRHAGTACVAGCVPSIRDDQRDFLADEGIATNLSLHELASQTTPSLLHGISLSDDDPSGDVDARDNALGELASSTFLAYSCVFSDVRSLYGVPSHRRLVEQTPPGQQVASRPLPTTSRPPVV